MSILRSESVHIGATSAWLKALPAVWLFCVGCIGATAHAEPCHSYSFKNDAGGTEYSNSIPAEQANRGYSCLDAHGTVIEVVPPKLTPDQQAQRERDVAAEKAAREAGLPRPRQTKSCSSDMRRFMTSKRRAIGSMAAIDARSRRRRKDLEALTLRRRDVRKAGGRRRTTRSVAVRGRALKT